MNFSLSLRLTRVFRGAQKKDKKMTTIDWLMIGFLVVWLRVVYALIYETDEGEEATL